jgi:copper(I)-binding protein
MRGRKLPKLPGSGIGAMLVLLVSACGGGGGSGAHGEIGDITVSRAVAWSAADIKGATIGMEIHNAGDAADTLVGVSAAVGDATLHSEAPGQGMQPVPLVPLERKGSLRFGRGLHVMVTDLPKSPAPGDSVRLTLRFARAGALDLNVPVLKYSAALTALGE